MWIAEIMRIPKVYTRPPRMICADYMPRSFEFCHVSYSVPSPNFIWQNVLQLRFRFILQLSLDPFWLSLGVLDSMNIQLLLPSAPPCIALHF